PQRDVAALGAQGRADDRQTRQRAHVDESEADDCGALYGGFAIDGVQVNFVRGEMRPAHHELLEGRQFGPARDHHPAVEEGDASEAARGSRLRAEGGTGESEPLEGDRKSTRLNS